MTTPLSPGLRGATTEHHAGQAALLPALVVVSEPACVLTFHLTPWLICGKHDSEKHVFHETRFRPDLCDAVRTEKGRWACMCSAQVKPRGGTCGNNSPTCCSL